MEQLNQDLVKSNKTNFFKTLWKEYSIVVVFIGIFIACTIITQGKFASLNNIMAILRNISTIGLISMGMTFVLISGGIDLSSGGVLATSGAVLIILQGSGKVPLWIAILACLSVAIGFGFINGIIITKTNLPAFIVTLAIGIMARSIVMFFTKGATITGRTVHEFTNIGNGNIVAFDFGGNIAPPSGVKNLSDYIIEFYYKCGANVPAITLYALTTRWGVSDPLQASTAAVLNVGGAAPTIWTYKRIKIPGDFSGVFGTASWASKSLIVQQIKEFTWYLAGVGPHTLDIAGLTIRRR